MAVGGMTVKEILEVIWEAVSVASILLWVVLVFVGLPVLAVFILGRAMGAW